MQRFSVGCISVNAIRNIKYTVGYYTAQDSKKFFRPWPTEKRVASTLNFQDLDKKWQKRWEEERVARQEDQGEKEYVLAMFPYPSGALHMGHVRVYTIADVLARFKRMQGNKLSRHVIYPMGWDAFGLPAENAAIERGLDPAEWTKANIGKMKEQLQSMNTDIDWSRELVTCSSDFYQHTQRIFLLLHEHGLAYQAESLVNYDPIDQTVLANEQVDSNGFSWRSGAKVEKLNLKQWFFRITAFRDELLEDLKLLKKWPERVIAMQQNWLGKSTGTRLCFEIIGDRGDLPSSISVFTTRLDTLFGVQFLALSASHPFVIECAKHDADLAAFISAIHDLPDASKAGYRVKGRTAKNPMIKVCGTPNYIHVPLSIWVAPYVMSDYGEGAIMGVPAHDDRDFAFWKQNCPGEQIIPAIKGLNLVGGDDAVALQSPFTERGRMRLECKPYGDLTSEEASERIFEDLKVRAVTVDKVDTWRLRDWLISRQRYWGTPIPVVHCKSCGIVPVPSQDLPVELPKMESNIFKKRKGNPLEEATEWLNVACPKCSQPAKRDTDTMDTFVDSSWYMFRFIDPHNELAPFAIDKADRYMPVDTYVGGIEHAILHLLYARFIGKFLAKVGLWPAGQATEVRGEPFRQLISQGMVHGKTFSVPETGRFLKPEEVDTKQISRPLIKSSQQIPNITFEKMSKSKYNGVDPTEVICRYGADVTRVHMLFQAPVSEILEWEDARIVGVHRWLARLYKYIESVASILAQPGVVSFESSLLGDCPFGVVNIPSLSQNHAKLYLRTEQTIASLTTALADTHSLNICISDLMTLTNDLTSTKDPLPLSLLYYTANTIIKLVGPFAPAFAEEAWETLHSKIPHSEKSLFDHQWPEAENLSNLENWAKSSLKQSCAIMENGKLRMVLDFDPLPEELSEKERLAWALEQTNRYDAGRKWLKKKEGAGGWSKIVVVKDGRTVNFVGRVLK